MEQADWEDWISEQHTGTLNPFRYCGYAYDEETGLYYLRSRYYNPVWGRFISSDILLGKTRAVLSHNLYAYCENTPIVHHDQNGTFLMSVLAAKIAGAVIGAAIGVVAQYVGDVMVNLLEGNSGADIFVPSSSVADYIGAALSGALSSTSITRTGAVIMNGIIGGGVYLANCEMNGVEFDAVDAATSVAISMCSGFIGGERADVSKRMGVIDTAKHNLNTAISPKKMAMNTGKIVVSKRIMMEAAGATVNATLFGRFSGAVMNWSK